MCTRRINNGVRVEYYSPAEYRKLRDKILNMKGDLRLMPVGEMDTAIKYLSSSEYRKFRDNILKEKNKAIYDNMVNWFYAPYGEDLELIDLDDFL